MTSHSIENNKVLKVIRDKENNEIKGLDVL